MPWPSTLPRPNANGYALRPVDPTIRTDMEVGAARTRRRTTARNDVVSCTVELTDVQFATFRTWFENPVEAAGGAAWFTIDLAIGTTGVVTTTARFKNVYQAEHRGGLNWEVTMELEVR